MSGLVTCGILQLIVAVVYDKNPGAKVTGQVLVAFSCLYLMSYNVRSRPHIAIQWPPEAHHANDDTRE